MMMWLVGMQVMVEGEGEGEWRGKSEPGDPVKCSFAKRYSLLYT